MKNLIVLLFILSLFSCNKDKDVDLKEVNIIKYDTTFTPGCVCIYTKSSQKMNDDFAPDRIIKNERREFWGADTVKAEEFNKEYDGFVNGVGFAHIHEIQKCDKDTLVEITRRL